MEIFEEYDFTGRDCRIWEIYKAYQRFCNQRECFIKFLPHKKDPRESKNWPYFAAVYEFFKKDSMFDPHIFIEAQFRDLPKDKIIFPAQLKTKAAAIRYNEHKEALKIIEENVITDTEKIMTNLANTLTFLKKWWKKNNLLEGDYSSLFKKDSNEIMSEGMILCMQNMLSKYFIAVSIHFNREYNKLDSDIKCEIITPKELENFRVQLRINEYAYNFAKEIFEGEIL